MVLLAFRMGLALLAGVFGIFAGTASGQITPEMIDGAKKEGEVMFYGAVTVKASKVIGDLFEKKYGIKLKHWRGEATEIVNRVLAEARAGRPIFDVTLGNEAVMQALHGRGWRDAWRNKGMRKGRL